MFVPFETAAEEAANKDRHAALDARTSHRMLGSRLLEYAPLKVGESA